MVRALRGRTPWSGILSSMPSLQNQRAMFREREHRAVVGAGLLGEEERAELVAHWGAVAAATAIACRK
jgi:hypothetical protein